MITPLEAGKYVNPAAQGETPGAPGFFYFGIPEEELSTIQQHRNRGKCYCCGKPAGN
jgi:hypothetical protein